MMPEFIFPPPFHSIQRLLCMCSRGRRLFAATRCRLPRIVIAENLKITKQIFPSFFSSFCQVNYKTIPKSISRNKTQIFNTHSLVQRRFIDTLLHYEKIIHRRSPRFMPLQHPLSLFGICTRFFQPVQRLL